MKEKVFFIIKNYYHILLLALPFLVMDAGIRYIGRSINYSHALIIIPHILFVLVWVAMIAGITFCLKRWLARIVYIVFFLPFFVLFITNCVYYPLTGHFFNFNLLLSADEGSAYILDSILGADRLVWVMTLMILGLFVLAFIKIPKKEKFNIKPLIIIFICFIVSRFLIPCLLGSANDELAWDTWRNPRNVYENFNDSNKCMKICGLFEYSVKDFYVTFLKPDEPEDPEELAFLEEFYSKETSHESNDMTGIFEGKNVIFLQLEGLDNWMLTEKDTPNLYELMNESISFIDHYSYYNGGGSTFNSELAVNTGLITPVSYNQNAYTFSSNLFEDTLPKLFKERGYSVNAFHMNTEEYYSRGINYKNWGYDNYYGLIDISRYSDISYELDRELVENDEFYELLFKQEQPFLHYIITYTPHTPFVNTKGVGEYLAEELYGENIPEMDEEAVAKMFAGETDRMIGELLQGLKDNGLYENTVIVSYADHYLYTINDKTVLDKYKNTDNNLINQTPFFIWSSDLGEYVNERVVEKTNSQLDILPTVLNLFGFEYIEEYYIGNDIFDENYSGYVFFSDYSWYNGSIYYDGTDGNADVINTGKAGEVTNEHTIKSISEEIKDIVRVNDLTLKYDYLRRISDE